MQSSPTTYHGPTWPELKEWDRSNWAWTDIVIHALQFFHGTAPLKALYRAIAASPAAKERDWKTKVRTTLRRDTQNFCRVAPGIWGINWPPLEYIEDIDEMILFLRKRRQYMDKTKARR